MHTENDDRFIVGNVYFRSNVPTLCVFHSSWVRTNSVSNPVPDEHVHCLWPPINLDPTRCVKLNIPPSKSWLQYRCEIISKCGMFRTV